VGLDTVEIVMRIEEEFSINLPDADLSSVVTVGDLYGIVLNKLETTPRSSCLSSKAFYRTRRALVDSLGMARRSIRPATPLEPLLPTESRRHQWAEIAKTIGLKFPKLQPSRSQKDFFLTLGIAIPTVLVLALWATVHVYLGIAVGNIAFWAAAFVLWALLIGVTASVLLGLSRSLALKLPAPTAGDLARMVLTMNFTTFAPASNGTEPLDREDVWERIVFIFSDQMQIDVEEIVPGARIGEDLRID
jgi:hypothetical protein